MLLAVGPAAAHTGSAQGDRVIDGDTFRVWMEGRATPLRDRRGHARYDAPHVGRPTLRPRGIRRHHGPAHGRDRSPGSGPGRCRQRHRRPTVARRQAPRRRARQRDPHPRRVRHGHGACIPRIVSKSFVSCTGDLLGVGLCVSRRCLASQQAPAGWRPSPRHGTRDTLYAAVQSEHLSPGLPTENPEGSPLIMPFVAPLANLVRRRAITTQPGGNLSGTGDCFMKPIDQPVPDPFIKLAVIARRGDRRAGRPGLPTDGSRSHRPLPVPRTLPTELCLPPLALPSQAYPFPNLRQRCNRIASSSDLGKPAEAARLEAR